MSKKHSKPSSAPPVPEEKSNETIFDKKPKIHFKNETQEKFWLDSSKHDINILYGSAGSGKSFIAAAKALTMLFNKEVDEIIIFKPTVEMGSKLGYLPGSEAEKIFVYVYSTLYVMEKIVGKRRLEKLQEQGYIKKQALCYTRGITFDRTAILMEEAQNMSPHEMKTFLTRIGEGTKYFITGDESQSDLFKRKEDSGLYDVITRLKNIPQIGLFEFSDNDVVRHPIIPIILQRYRDISS